MASGDLGRSHAEFLMQLVGAKRRRIGEAWPNPLCYDVNGERPLQPIACNAGWTFPETPFNVGAMDPREVETALMFNA